MEDLAIQVAYLESNVVAAKAGDDVVDVVQPFVEGTMNAGDLL